jgi:lipopolysaccharide O-acetyltransferase
MEAITRYGGQRFEPQIIIRDNVGAVDFVHIAATCYVEIGNNVLLASRVYISDHNHGIYTGDAQSDPNDPPGKRPLDSDKKVIIGDNVWIGQQVSVLPGVSIGEGCVIGANSVVTKNIPAYSLAVGNPAKVIKRFDKVSGKWTSVKT